MVDKETLEASNKKVKEALKAYNRALDKAEKANKHFEECRKEVDSARENYLAALEESKEAAQ